MGQILLKVENKLPTQKDEGYFFEKLNSDLSLILAFHDIFLLFTSIIRLILRLYLCLTYETITPDEQKSTRKKTSR
jgi:hypothetical protein